MVAGRRPTSSSSPPPASRSPTGATATPCWRTLPEDDPVLDLPDEVVQLFVDLQAAPTARGAGRRARRAPSSSACYAESPASLGALCARHILVETESEADDVLAELDAGADFAELAAERSTDPAAAETGGVAAAASASPLTALAQAGPDVPRRPSRRSEVGVPTRPGADDARVARHRAPAVRRDRRAAGGAVRRAGRRAAVRRLPGDGRRRRRPALRALGPARRAPSSPCDASPATRRRPTVVVVGLGPGGHEHVTVETLAGDRAHPAPLPAHGPAPERRPRAGGRRRSTTSTSPPIASRTSTRRSPRRSSPRRIEHGEVLYAVPGSPLVLERTVRLLQADERVDCVVLPAMSFLDLAWARLGIDPVESGVRLIDGHEFATAAAGVSGADADRPHPRRLGAVGHQAGRRGRHRRRAGRHPPGPRHARRVDHRRRRGASSTGPSTPDHLTCVYVPALGVPVGAGYVRFHQLARTLREQCPWDREQTHAA